MPGSHVGARVKQDASYRAMQALCMAETMAKPANREKARAHAQRINRDPEVREKQNAGRARHGWRGNRCRKRSKGNNGKPHEPADKLLARLRRAARHDTAASQTEAAE